MRRRRNRRQGPSGTDGKASGREGKGAGQRQQGRDPGEAVLKQHNTDTYADTGDKTQKEHERRQKSDSFSVAEYQQHKLRWRVIDTIRE